MAISGIGSGELLLNFTIQDTAPVLNGSYTYDLSGIHIPPIESFNITSSNKTGYTYTLPGIYMPGKPNNFTVSASKVKNLNIGVRKNQGSSLDSSTIFKPEYTRIWIDSQIEANQNGTATTTSDLISPGSYQIRIFGDATENSSSVNLTMNLIKKVIINGRFNLDINMTGFPKGSYKINAKAVNGSVRFDGINLESSSH